MTRKSALELIERLEKAAGPDRDLDGAIYRSLHASHDDAWPHWTTVQRDEIVLHYTASIDAAVTLVPFAEDKATHWGVELDRGFEAWVSRNNVSSGHWLHQGFGSTPAIALCIAALKARSTP